MKSTHGITRREIISASAALGTAATFARPAAAGAQMAATAPLPQRTEFVVRNAHVLSMDDTIGNLAQADVHVRNGEIVAVGSRLHAPHAVAIEGRAMIAMPGLIDAHNHIWTTLERNFVREGIPGRGYYPTTLALAKQYTPTDIYRSVLLGVAEALNSGITTIHDWSHNIRMPQFADADIAALQRSGIRARFSYGTYQGGPAPDRQMDIADLTRLAHDWHAHARDGLLTLGMASRSLSSSARGAVLLDVLQRDWKAARDLGLPITIHTSAVDLVAKLDAAGLMGPDVQLVHPVGWSANDIEIVARSKASVCCAPTTDVRLSYGPIGMQELTKRDIRLSMSCDTPGVSGAMDLFSEMHLLYAQQCQFYKDATGMMPPEILKIATINGARDLGIADRTGSLTPGKRADLILVRTNDLNMAPLGDPVEAIVRSAQPANVDTVIVDGRMLKAGGKLTAIDVAAVVANATDSFEALKRRVQLV